MPYFNLRLYGLDCIISAIVYSRNVTIGIGFFTKLDIIFSFSNA